MGFEGLLMLSNVAEVDAIAKGGVERDRAYTERLET